MIKSTSIVTTPSFSSSISKSNHVNEIITGSIMETLSFHEFKKKAFFFLKEKFQAARLIVTDVTPAELLAEEVTSGNQWPPEARKMGVIARAAFEVDDYWRIVGILHKRFLRFDKKQWRESYNSLILLEHLLMHGPQSFSDEFQIDKVVIKDVGTFSYIDGKGFDWGLALRSKSERVLKLLEKGTHLIEERERAREVTRRISRKSSSSVTAVVVEDNQNNNSLQFSNLKPERHDSNMKSSGGQEELPKRNLNGKNAEEPSDIGILKEDHPFTFIEHHAEESLLS